MLDESTCESAVTAGAQFLISPGLEPGVGAVARSAGIPYIPGALTPTEVRSCLAEGATLVKLFPAAPLGAGYVSQLLGPFPKLRLVPTGGIDASNASAFLHAGAAAVAIGASLVGRDSTYDSVHAAARRLVSAIAAKERYEMPVEGILPVIPTPFRNGAFDAESFQRLLDHMLPFVDGYTLLGSTGEAPSMSLLDRQHIAERALAMTPADKRVVVGVTDSSSDNSAELARHADAHGAAAILCASPFYFANTPDGVLAHLSHVDAAIGIDLGEHVPLLDGGVEVHEDARDTPVHLRADVDLQERLHGSGGLHLLRDIAGRDGAGDEFCGRWRPVPEQEQWRPVPVRWPVSRPAPGRRGARSCVPIADVSRRGGD